MTGAEVPKTTGAAGSRCIAVVAVHGVGDHQPCASARAVGDMLAGRRIHENKPKYSVFRENLLRLKVGRTTGRPRGCYRSRGCRASHRPGRNRSALPGFLVPMIRTGTAFPMTRIG